MYKAPPVLNQYLEDVERHIKFKEHYHNLKNVTSNINMKPHDCCPRFKMYNKRRVRERLNQKHQEKENLQYIMDIYERKNARNSLENNKNWLKASKQSGAVCVYGTDCYSSKGPRQTTTSQVVFDEDVGDDPEAIQRIGQENGMTVIEVNPIRKRPCQKQVFRPIINPGKKGRNQRLDINTVQNQSRYGTYNSTRERHYDQRSDCESYNIHEPYGSGFGAPRKTASKIDDQLNPNCGYYGGTYYPYMSTQGQTIGSVKDLEYSTPFDDKLHRGFIRTLPQLTIESNVDANLQISEITRQSSPVSKNSARPSSKISAKHVPEAYGQMDLTDRELRSDEIARNVSGDVQEAESCHAEGDAHNAGKERRSMKSDEGFDGDNEDKGDNGNEMHKSTGEGEASPDDDFGDPEIHGDDFEPEENELQSTKRSSPKADEKEFDPFEGTDEFQSRPQSQQSIDNFECEASRISNKVVDNNSFERTNSEHEGTSTRLAHDSVDNSFRSFDGPGHVPDLSHKTIVTSLMNSLNEIGGDYDESHVESLMSTL